MKLKYYISKSGDKVYTLKEIVNKEKTQEAHYKFIKYVEDYTNSEI